MLHNEELDSSLNIFRMFKSRRLKWAGYVARNKECSTFKIETHSTT